MHAFDFAVGLRVVLRGSMVSDAETGEDGLKVVAEKVGDIVGDHRVRHTALADDGPEEKHGGLWRARGECDGDGPAGAIVDGGDEPLVAGGRLGLRVAKADAAGSG